MAGKRRKHQVRRKKRPVTLGRKLVLPADPPSFTQLPWWRVITSDQPKVDSSKIKTYTGQDLWNILVAQTGVSSTTSGKASISVRSVGAWNTSGKSLALDCYDLHVDNRIDLLSQIEDTPGRNHWARCGFRWPTSQQANCVDAASSAPVCKIAAPPGSELEVRFVILWKPRGISTPNDAECHLISRMERLCTPSSSSPFSSLY